MTNTARRALLGAATLSLLGAATLAPSATAAQDTPAQSKPGHYSFAVIGDVPYGAGQIADFPRWIGQINAADPRFTIHVGDIKNGATPCADDYYTMIKANFDLFAAPLIYTPGDNEWTDCHREANGTYNPLERLAYDRSVFFAQPGMTLGQRPMKVASDAANGFPENVRWRAQQVSFATLHIVGSSDDLAPWYGLGLTEATPEQVAEQQARMSSARTTMRTTFAAARATRDRAVVLSLQADMFGSNTKRTDVAQFTPLVQAMIDEASTFDGEVYLINGDSHAYYTDTPLATGSPWLDAYGVTGSADNVVQVTVDGAENNGGWLKMTVSRPGADSVLSWQRVPYTS